MIVALAGRVIGPAATLMLLAFLAGYPAQYTASYAIFAAYMQFGTAPLNPYTEHFKLREILSGRSGGLKEGLLGLLLIWIGSIALVFGLEHSRWLLWVIPLLGLGHLLTKVRAALLRANHCNALAIVLEFTLRPTLLLFFVAVIFYLLGPSELGLIWAFALTGIATIFVAFTVTKKSTTGAFSETSSEHSSPIGFVLLGMFMVIVSQFEVFAMGWLADVQALANYKVALQLASICGVATNFVLMNNLRALYASPIQSEAYRLIFRRVRQKTFTVSFVFTLVFLLIALIWPVLWSSDTWLLAAGASIIFAVSAAFGPLANWFYSAGRIQPIAISLGLMLTVKIILLIGLTLANIVGAASLLLVYGIGLLFQNVLLYVLKERATV